MTTPTGNRLSGPSLPGDQADGSADPGDVRAGVEERLASQGQPTEQADNGHTGHDTGRAARGSLRPPEDRAALGPDADAEKVARKILLDQLTGQARSRADLAARLAKRGVPGKVAERLLTRFEEVGLIDDEAFARDWVQSRHAGKGLARRALAQELRRKGIGDEVAREALDEVDPETEVESARLLVRRKMRSVRRVDRNTAIRRLTGMLARKGYPGGVAMRVVREELAEAGRDADDVVEQFE